MNGIFFVLDSGIYTEITRNIELLPDENHCMIIDSRGAWEGRKCDQQAQAFICEYSMFLYSFIMHILQLGTL